MKLFSGEKYSKKAYNGALGALLLADLNNMDARDRDLEKVLGKGQEEAVALNEEHKRLVTKVREAVEALEDFEKEKLGMS